ncbi:ligase-associated DNA damage response exonuclease [Ekhidna sp.]|uniref:ligase-associated DNA damage response exonuclease n=1 Tax=Ekhidna sp. TaxID=2608089 RepID=UPI003CCC2E6C
MSTPLLSFTNKGIYCPAGKFYIDPWQPVNDAIITHGHADHSRPGHRQYLTHKDSVSILKYRLGNISINGIGYNETVLKNGVKVSLHPAGHILGSAQVRVEHKGEVWCVSGDYKTGPDPVAVDFEPVKCHTFITECTFGLPAFNWPTEKEVINQIENWWRTNIKSGKVSILTAYALGKAQRILAMIDTSIGPIYSHGAVDAINQIYQKEGFLSGHFPYVDPSTPKQQLEGALIIAPPSAVGSAWGNKWKPLSIGMASGWMMLRGSRRRRNVDGGFVLSDHADWKGLNTAIKETGAENIICTHGYTEAFSEWLNHLGYNAVSEKTLYEGESLENKAEEQ